MHAAGLLTLYMPPPEHSRPLPCNQYHAKHSHFSTHAYKRAVQAALEKIADASVLLHLVDFSTHAYLQHSCRATLEEIADASVLLHLVDISHPNAAAQCDAVLQVRQRVKAFWWLFFRRHVVRAQCYAVHCTAWSPHLGSICLGRAGLSSLVLAYWYWYW